LKLDFALTVCKSGDWNWY